ncbi:hypothetical protein GCM10011344_20920 [Dokdonia pacifica]|uniref:Helix-turn-helix domain-containing protein n=1 Tax=Dokdonia pacifica TaxID=1627892 RepID=A0A238VM55_9FLAO|nr:helix-turn-helix domain-containing protein [Dokdonia pacifica]GGG20084.1 hypothetical protein GCM10011344_20920 [Dokdonia pacifica]SNR35435.1 Helix-turn-helix domain-containing protein [Dokdonia pacifica]
MEVICLHDEAFYTLIDEVIDRIKEKNNTHDEIWITPERAMKLLNIKSKSTLQNLRDTGAITYTQPQRKIILYKYESVLEYLEKNSKQAF